jgi:hypothetical protein
MFSNSSQFRDWSRLQQARDEAPEDPQCYNYPDAFYPDKGGGLMPSELKWAKDTCNTCPLKLICGEYGIRWERHGVWGGLSAKERADIRRERKIPEPIEDEAA